jgi:hypothetical protein
MDSSILFDDKRLGLTVLNEVGRLLQACDKPGRCHR